MLDPGFSNPVGSLCPFLTTIFSSSVGNRLSSAPKPVSTDHSAGKRAQLSLVGWALLSGSLGSSPRGVPSCLCVFDKLFNLSDFYLICQMRKMIVLITQGGREAPRKYTDEIFCVHIVECQHPQQPTPMACWGELKLDG